MNNKKLDFIQGNTTEGIKITIKDRNTGGPLDMTNTKLLDSATLYVYNNRTGAFLFTKALDTTLKDLGILMYTPDATNFDTTGDDFRLEVKLDFNDTTIGRIREGSISITTKAPIS